MFYHKKIPDIINSPTSNNFTAVSVVIPDIAVINVSFETSAYVHNTVC